MKMVECVHRSQMSLAPSYSKQGHNSRTEKVEKVQTKPSLPFMVAYPVNKFQMICLRRT